MKATLDAPQVTAFVQQALDLCISLLWTGACSRQLVAIEHRRRGQGHQDAGLAALLEAQAQVSGALLISKL